MRAKTTGDDASLADGTLRVESQAASTMRVDSPVDRAFLDLPKPFEDMAGRVGEGMWVDDNDPRFKEIVRELVEQGNRNLLSYNAAVAEPDDAFMKALRAGSDVGIAAGTALAQKMMRKLTPEEKAEYSQLGSGYAAKVSRKNRGNPI